MFDQCSLLSSKGCTYILHARSAFTSLVARIVRRSQTFRHFRSGSRHMRPAISHSSGSYPVLAATHREACGLSVRRITAPRNRTVPCFRNRTSLVGFAYQDISVPTLFTLMPIYGLVHRKGLEPLTHGLEGHCSVQLSYQCIKRAEALLVNCLVSCRN